MVIQTTPLPDAPQRGEGRDDYSDQADAFADALPTFQIELNQQALEVDALAAQAAASAASAVASPNTFATSSTTNLMTLGTKTFNIQAGKTFVKDMWVSAIRFGVGTTWMKGPVISYNSTSGDLVVDVQKLNGTGSYSSWTIVGTNPDISDSAPRNLATGSTMKDSAGTDFEVGFMDVPGVAVTGATTLAIVHRGKCVESTDGGTITVPPSVFLNGATIMLWNRSNSNMLVALGSGVTMTSTGNQTGQRYVKPGATAILRRTQITDRFTLAGELV